MRVTGMHFATTLALSAALALAVGCDADRDAGAADSDAEPDAALPATDGPVDLPPPVVEPGPTPGPGGDADPPTDVDPAPDASAPTRFQGTYAADPAACDTTGHVSHLIIGSDTITFHESSGPITEVASGPSDVTITAELTGEGETRQATYRFRLSDDGRTLTDLGGGMERVRCD
ncbi:MAG TPA: hypothetical protein VFS99_07420 [Xanthomonadaceae bacterium]|nr:hypothetical protein [Xanthomonadaceae bacterium]